MALLWRSKLLKGGQHVMQTTKANRPAKATKAMASKMQQIQKLFFRPESGAAYGANSRNVGQNVMQILNAFRLDLGVFLRQRKGNWTCAMVQGDCLQIFHFLLYVFVFCLFLHFLGIVVIFFVFFI